MQAFQWSGLSKTLFIALNTPKHTGNFLILCLLIPVMCFPSQQFVSL